MKFNTLPTKASPAGRGRRVVYLDQNVVSDLARLRLGRMPNEKRTVALRVLLDALREATFEKQTTRCVESFFHLWESSGLVDENKSMPRADALFQDIWELLVTHSWGLQLLTTHEVTEFQTLVTVAAETGLHNYARKYLWRGAFSDDPNERNEKKGIRFEGSLFILGVPWRPSSLLKKGWAAIVEDSRAKGHDASFDAALHELRVELRDLALEDNRRYSWAHKWGDYERAMAPEDVMHFISSDAHGELPINDVLTRVGARILGDKDRALKESDGADMRILSLAVPYCDLVVTDRYMASVANGLGLGEKYTTRIVPSTTQGLHEATAWLRRVQLSSNPAA